MNQDSALQCRQAAKVQHNQREPFIGHQSSIPIAAGTAAADERGTRVTSSCITLRSFRNLREQREKAKLSRFEYDPSAISLEKT